MCYQQVPEDAAFSVAREHHTAFDARASFDYLTELQRHVQELAANPAEWMPWNYRETLARI